MNAMGYQNVLQHYVVQYRYTAAQCYGVQVCPVGIPLEQRNEDELRIKSLVQKKI